MTSAAGMPVNKKELFFPCISANGALFVSRNWLQPSALLAIRLFRGEIAMRFGNAVVFFLAGAILVGGSISGDDTKPTKTKGQLPPGFNKLNLTEDQKNQIFKIQGTYKKKISALRKQIEELRDKQKTETFNVLTKDQKAKLLGAGGSGDTRDKKVKKDKVSSSTDK
jgi:hypothetical protein